MDNKYAGMTVNERLYVSGLIDEFDRAVSEKNTDAVVRILKEVELTEEYEFCWVVSPMPPLFFQEYKATGLCQMRFRQANQIKVVAQ